MSQSLPTTTSLSDFYDMLSKHDWTYMMSDDHSVYQRGSLEASKLKRIADSSMEHLKLYNDYSNYIWHEGAKPTKPETT